MSNAIKAILIIVGVSILLGLAVKLFGLAIVGSSLLALLLLASFIGNYK